MMLRLITLYLVAEKTRKAGGAINQQDKTGLLIEHPAAPEDTPEVVSWWWTLQWHSLRKTYHSTYDVDQGELGGITYKPTTLETNMILSCPEQKVKKPQRIRQDPEMTPEERVRLTKSLARWCPVMMSGIAEGCMRTVG